VSSEKIACVAAWNAWTNSTNRAKRLPASSVLNTFFVYVYKLCRREFAKKILVRTKFDPFPLTNLKGVAPGKERCHLISGRTSSFFLIGLFQMIVTLYKNTHARGQKKSILDKQTVIQHPIQPNLSFLCLNVPLSSFAIKYSKY